MHWWKDTSQVLQDGDVPNVVIVGIHGVMAAKKNLITSYAKNKASALCKNKKKSYLFCSCNDLKAVL